MADTFAVTEAELSFQEFRVSGYISAAAAFNGLSGYFIKLDPTGGGNPFVISNPQVERNFEVTLNRIDGVRIHSGHFNNPYPCVVLAKVETRLSGRLQICIGFLISLRAIMNTTETWRSIIRFKLRGSAKVMT